MSEDKTYVQISGGPFASDIEVWAGDVELTETVSKIEIEKIEPDGFVIAKITMLVELGLEAVMESEKHGEAG